ncbi:MAG: hypothetical protein COT43_01045 [Candidatus Marinimicrobia bacterium CG08_land_8_20_14_0_20_45_22]|nr:MAG: hypothetical protein COT43_01045 [Candidatus Marinimicrobia bacterium CG08_land_8_20_14_0_20_45_22]
MAFLTWITLSLVITMKTMIAGIEDRQSVKNSKLIISGTTAILKPEMNLKSAAFITGNQITAIEMPGEILTDFALFQNYPNPFNPMTTIVYSIAVESVVKLQIYDLLGREVKTLVNQRMPSGKHIVNFNAKELKSGIYFYKIKAGDFEQMKRMILIK